MSVDRAIPQVTSATSSWRAVVAKYQQSDLSRSLWQVANTFVPYLVLWYLMYRSLAYSYWLTLALALVASGFLMRVFIIFHDCGHGSFFRSKRANQIVGSICGVFTFTPFFQWRHDHAMHHASTGDIDRRGTGDVPTLMVQEYLQLGRWGRLTYRIKRNPIVMLTAGPVMLFLFEQRFCSPHAGPRERRSVYGTNVAVLAVIVFLSLVLGWQAYLLIQFPVILFTGAMGIWLFYCQHQFEGTYWAPHEEWDYERAALEGSSYFRLPKVLQWFTGNIGFHHVHHLSPRIPNYNLEACHGAHPRFQEATTITLSDSLKSFSLKLWDEERQALVGIRELRQKALTPVAAATDPLPAAGEGELKPLSRGRERGLGRGHS